MTQSIHPSPIPSPDTGEQLNVPVGPTDTIKIQTTDGTTIGGFCWRAVRTDALATRPVVVITAATSVRCRYYFRFADYLHAHGFDVIVYDYRGIGESRPQKMRGFSASWSDWGGQDFDAVLAYALREFPGRPIHVVGHSFGGCAPGMAPHSAAISRMVTVGAQFAYWRDYALSHRLGMLAKWHMFMPVLTDLMGYFPGKRLGWLEDTPKGVVRDWIAPAATFDELPSVRKRAAQARRRAVRSALYDSSSFDAQASMPGFSVLSAPILAISLTDDEYGTVAGIERLLDHYVFSARTHLRVAPADLGLSSVGHFAFFHSRHQSDLWPIALAWLEDGKLPASVPGTIASLREGSLLMPGV